ncbi:MAG TPA: 50S ribosomal protein L11 methyltransferase [Nitrolancea sp.]|nr:50S ribosomal protein L11 methyltransferase [Nitrolancea sp.]
MPVKLVDSHSATTSTDWLEVTVDADAESVDAVVELFSRYVYNQGVVLNEPFVQDQDGDNLEIDPTRPVSVSGYVPFNETAEDVVRRIDEGLWHLRQLGTVSELARQVVREQDWANSWKEHFQVTRIAKRFVVRPTWREYRAKDDDIVIDLDPGMAFGTGLHPTTALCLGWLESLDLAGLRVLDVGAGSGILSIAAVKLGANSIDAVEIDPVAVSALRHNIALNGLDDRVQTWTADATRPLPCSGPYDVILANIISRILVEAAESLTQVAGDCTVMVLSGVIEAHEAEVVDAFCDLGFSVAGRRVIGDWVSLLVKRESTS